MAALSCSEFQYDFVPPPECVVFEPTPEEFKDAMAYIEKIRHIGEQHGICKIKPPEDWQPPFAVDVDRLRFTPRIQRLNELEAHTRIKLNFLDQVAKFWELQGSSLKIPMVERRALDLYTLKKYVHKEGGFEKVNQEKKWQKVANDMGFSTTNKAIPSLLRNHYERIIFPLDIFEREEQKKAQLKAEEHSADDDFHPDECGEVVVKKEDNCDDLNEKEYKPHNIPCRMDMKPPQEKDKSARRSNRYDNGSHSSCGEASVKVEDNHSSFSKELARLQFFGAGPKMAGLPSEKSSKEKTRGIKLNIDYDPLAKYMCQNCGKGDAEEQMLLCDGCDDSYHTFCLMPPLAEIPKGDWRCPKCVAAEVSKPMEAFGFEQAQKEYNLQSFGEMADQFKSDYFNMPVHLIPTSLVEKEYWRILENIDEDVMVEYGADLHTIDHGSGFPTMASKNLSKEDEGYAKSEWNLNNLPILPNSILRYIDMDISGMKVPWLYVGMCFSTFCWHTEDHWTPSVNYLHWGEPKTWYGIPAMYAEKAEEVMRNSAKELFVGQPDLLHHIVTTMNPNVLQAHGVPVYRADQHAGEIMLTFPRAYHAGFNHGYNLAEAVNFAPPEWLEMGRKCVEHYSIMRRYCVFCHDELVCKMATNADKMTLQVASVTYNDMLTMIETEKAYRKELLEAGVTEAEREAFELLPDDERQCAICKTTIFLSALTSIDQKSEEIVCLRHFKSMSCEPDKLVLRYRYTLDELATLLMGVKARAESYDKWISRVKEALEARGDDRLELNDLKDLYDEANDRKYPASDLLEVLHVTLEEAHKCQTVAHQLANKKVVRTRTRGAADPKSRLTMEELQLFATQLETLPAKVSGRDCVEKLMEQVNTFQKRAHDLLKEEQADAKDLEECLEFGLGLDVELSELTELKAKQRQAEWLEQAKEMLEDPCHPSSFDQLKQILDEGRALSPDPKVEKYFGEITGLLMQVESWEEKAKACLLCKPRLSLPDMELLVSEGERISEGLPSLQALKETIRRTKDWLAKAELLGRKDSYPFVDSFEQLVVKGRLLPVKLDCLTQLETLVASARAWRERTTRVFAKKASSHSLLEILSPRTDIGTNEKKKPRKNNKDDSQIHHPIFANLTPNELAYPQAIVKAFKDAEAKELEAMKAYRQKNAQEDRKPDADMKDNEFECELCLDVFCPLQSSLLHPFPLSPSPSTARDASMRLVRLLCPNCLRSRRPRLETILQLLVSLQNLAVRLPEGEALRCLTERAMSWQAKAQKILKQDQVAEALSQLNKWKEGNNADLSSLEINLPISMVKDLENLLVEGDLLEVSLDDTQQIWSLLQALEPHRSKKLPDLSKFEAELDSAKDDKGRTKKKRKLEVDSGDKAKTKLDPITGSKKPLISNNKEPTNGKKRQPSFGVAEEETEDDEEGQEDCSASPKCHRPTGKEVHWVQCDGCELWFHLFCIGLKPDQVSEHEDFICKACTPAMSKKRKGEPPK